MRWTVDVSWECEVDAESEGEALMEAYRAFSFMSEANAEEMEVEEDEPAASAEGKYHDSNRDRYENDED